MWLEGIITYSIDYLTCLVPLSESFSIFWSVSESILAPILCVGWVKNEWPMRSSADPPILALKISLDGHFPSSYIKIEGKYTACAFNFCHLRPLLRYNRPWMKAPDWWFYDQRLTKIEFMTWWLILDSVLFQEVMSECQKYFCRGWRVWFKCTKYHAHAENSCQTEKNDS